MKPKEPILIGQDTHLSSYNVYQDNSLVRYFFEEPNDMPVVEFITDYSGLPFEQAIAAGWRYECLNETTGEITYVPTQTPTDAQ